MLSMGCQVGQGDPRKGDRRARLRYTASVGMIGVWQAEAWGLHHCVCVTHKADPGLADGSSFPSLTSSFPWETWKTCPWPFPLRVAGDHSKPLPFIAHLPLSFSQVQLLLGGDLAGLPTSAAHPLVSLEQSLLLITGGSMACEIICRRKERMRCTSTRISSKPQK